ncbi:MAG: Ig-like domain-containing protein [Thermoplasmata archaeon]|nr:Ig-like domain-containing protein [Thermoplasmata archaeon]
MGLNVGRITLISILLLSSLAALPSSNSVAGPVEHTYYLHAEDSNGIFNYLDLVTTPPEPNAITISIDVRAAGQFMIGEGWIQNENFNYARNMTGTWTFTMYVYCDDNIIDGQLFAKVFGGFSTRLNGAQNRSQPIGPCADSSTPKEVIWDDQLDHLQAGTFVDGERFRVEIWFDALFGGTTGTVRTPSDEIPSLGQTITGSYLDTQVNNEGGTQYEQLREVDVPCGNATKFDVVAEIGSEGKSSGGDYNSLLVNDEVFEIIGEDGNPNSLNWTWAIDISPGSGQYSLYLDALIDTPLNDDDFTVSYSTTGAFLGEEVTVFTIDDAWGGSIGDPPLARYDFPSGVLTGVPTVYIRILDTNEFDWPQVKDFLKLDRMYIELVEATSNCSALEHIWVIDNLPGATSHQLLLSGHHSVSSDGDDFQFSRSFEGPLSKFQDTFVLTNTTDEDFYLNATISVPPQYNTLWLKAMDSDRTPGSPPSRDDLFIDHIYTFSLGGGTPFQLHLIADNATYQSRITTIEDSTADTMKPTSTVRPLPLYSDPVFDIEFLASDIGSGVHHIELWYILPDDTHAQYPGFYTTSPISFTAPGDGRYYFYTRAVDNALNYEDRPLMFDAMTIVDTTPPAVTRVRPSDGEIGIRLYETEVQIRFSETMDSVTVEQAFMLIEGKGKRAWRASDGVIKWNHPVNDSFTFTLTSGEAFKFGTTYTIVLDHSASDLAGNNLHTDFEATFDTEMEFDPTVMVIIIIIAAIMIVLLVYFMFVRRTPEEEKEETMQVAVHPPQMPPPQPPGPVYQPPTTYTPPPVAFTPPPAGTLDRPMWEAEKSGEEIWRDEQPKVVACNLCGRSISSQAQYCPHCGSRTMTQRPS